MNLSKLLTTKSQGSLTLISVLLVALIGLIDSFIPPECSLSIFYLIPICLATWFTNKHIGLFISFLSGFTWLILNQRLDKCYNRSLIAYWDIFVILTFFLFVIYLVSSLKDTFRKIENVARTDALTGLVNRRFFLEMLNIEISRALRYKKPLTIAYIDIDDFKQVNDTFGHSTGDKLLSLVAETAKVNLRKIDLIARLGGDEFAILLPETGYDAAQIVLRRVLTVLLESMKKNGWNVTFSIGAVTFLNPPNSVDEIIEKADNLMYLAKREGKNLFKHELSNQSSMRHPRHHRS
jgi:diguanylate cyclase (GGDEF)-like protein